MLANFSFIQLADPQFGLFADRSGKTDEEISAAAKRGQILKKHPKLLDLPMRRDCSHLQLNKFNGQIPLSWLFLAT